MKIKFCGMQRQEDLDMAAAIKADYCGFIFHPQSKRYITPENAARLKTYSMKRIGVFVDHQEDEIISIMKLARLDYAQLHGNQTINCAKKIGSEKIIRVFWPQRQTSLETLQKELIFWETYCEYYLFDAGKSGGGHGNVLNWSTIAQLDFQKPWFLAGGIGASNIIAAKNACQPFALDLNSAVEIAPGKKNHELMRSAARMAGKEFE